MEGAEGIRDKSTPCGQAVDVGSRDRPAIARQEIPAQGIDDDQDDPLRLGARGRSPRA